MDRSFYEAVGMLMGTIVGAGIFGIPYVIAKAGLLVGLIEILVVGAAVTLLHLFVGEVSLRTKAKHQLVGFAGKYLGKWGKRAFTFSMVIGVYGALIAYLMGEGAALNAIFGLKNIIGMLIFFAIMAVFIYKDLNVIRGWELWMGIAMIALVIMLMAFAAPYAKLENMKGINLAEVFLPYGVILFACVGTAAIPTLEEEVKLHKSYLKKAILIGSIVPLFIYALFAIVIVGVTGAETTEIATINLGESLGQHMVLIGNFFVILAMATSFLALGLALKWVYVYDYRMNKRLSWALVCFVPLIVALSNTTTFIKTIGITGAIATGIEGILIVLLHRAAVKKGDCKPEYSIKGYKVVYAWLILMFVGGIIYTILELV